MKSLIVLACVVVASFTCATLTGCQSDSPRLAADAPEASKGLMNGMAKMDHDMMAAPMTGDADHDFAAMMIPHHQGAVDMAQAYLSQSKNPVLRRLAEEIIAQQPQEIAVMQMQLTREVDKPRASGVNDFAAELMRGMATMNHDMAAAVMTGDPDHDFAAMMIPHHQGAIDMARPFLIHGASPVLRRLASEMVITQAQEIEVMRHELAVHDVVAPAPALTYAVSSRDRVYTGDQTSNTVSVIDPKANKLLGVIRLGDPVPGALSALYRGQLLVHGIGFSPDHRTIAVVSVGSNSVTLIDTATNAVKGTVYVGRSPHEAFFTPDGREVWATVRGENYVSVIDPIRMKEIRRVTTANGPGMVLFRPDGRYAFIPSSFTPELAVVDTRTYEVVSRVPQASPFSPNLAVGGDGTEVWFTLKDSGKTQVISAVPPFNITATLDTGPITNHVALIENENGKFAYITVGAENKVKVYRRGGSPQWVASIATGDLPHGIWGSGDGSRVYVGLENQDEVVAIDTLSNRIIATVAVGQQPQALVYVPDAVREGNGLSNLTPLGAAGDASHLKMARPAGNADGANGTVSVNAIGALDLVQAAVSGLKPETSYKMCLSKSRASPLEASEILATFKTNVAGAQIVQAIGPLRNVIRTSDKPAAATDARFLCITAADTDAIELIQTNSP